MTETDPSYEAAKEAHDYLMRLGDLSLKMAGIERFTRYTIDRAENDAEHSFHLGLSAVEISANYFPDYDIGLVAQFSNVHDLPEVITGDKPTHNLTPEERIVKDANDKAAAEKLRTELPPYTAELLRRYEEQIEPEARLVRFVDKLLPSIIHAVATEANTEVYTKEYDNNSIDEILAKREIRTEMLRTMFPDIELEFIFLVRELTSATARSRIFANRPELM